MNKERKEQKKAVNPYGKGDTSAGIVKEIKNYLKNSRQYQKRNFTIFRGGIP